MTEWQQDEVPNTTFKKSRGPGWVIGLIILVLAGVAIWKFGPWKLKPELGAVDLSSAADAGPPDAGPQVSASDGDPLLREKVGALSKSADLSKWLADADLIRRLTAAVNLIAEGESPAPVLTFLEVKGPFEVNEVYKKGQKKRPVKKVRGKVKGKPPPESLPEHIYLDPKSYQRYDAITETFNSVDYAGAGKVYGTVRPYFDAAFREIGRPGKKFDEVLVRALKRLESVKVPEGQVELKAEGVVYQFADTNLESLSPAEKHLLRMGPANAGVIQAAIRAFLVSSGL